MCTINAYKALYAVQFLKANKQIERKYQQNFYLKVSINTNRYIFITCVVVLNSHVHMYLHIRIWTSSYYISWHISKIMQTFFVLKILLHISTHQIHLTKMLRTYLVLKSTHLHAHLDVKEKFLFTKSFFLCIDNSSLPKSRKNMRK